jgi:hypothetical protein
MPRGTVLSDPVTRRSFVVSRAYEHLLVAMATDDGVAHTADPHHPLPIACYRLDPSRTRRHQIAVWRVDQVVSDDGPMDDNAWAAVIDLHARTGVLHTTDAEIAELVEQLQRALATLRLGEHNRSAPQ